MRRSLVAAVALALAVSGTVQAGGPPPIVAGDYTYQYISGATHVQVGAHGGSGAGGWVDVAKGDLRFGGPVTCVTVVGDDAWVAGTVAYGDALGLDGWWLRVRDGGSPGAAGDVAITLIDEAALAQAACEGAITDVDGLMSPVFSGNLVVRH